jgi:hypothetical protein
MDQANGYTSAAERVVAGDYAGREVRKQRSAKLNIYPGRMRPSSRGEERSSSASPTNSHHPRAPLISHMGADITTNNSISQRSSPAQRSMSSGPYRTNSDASSTVRSVRPRQSEASRLRNMNNGYPTPMTNGKHTPEVVHAENFSRPRKLSKASESSPRPPLHTSSTFPMHSQDEEHSGASAIYRERGLSSSSSQSTISFPSMAVRPSVSIPDFSTSDNSFARQRNFSNLSNYRTGRGGLNEVNPANNRWEPTPKPQGISDEEIRASFRSALTTNSSFLGYSGTERSSVVTKSSSTSIFGRDEGMSVDDAIGMYETGFADSGAEEGFGSRPGTSLSYTSDMRMAETRDDALPPPTLPNMAARDSAAMFAKATVRSPDMPRKEWVSELTPRGFQELQPRGDREIDSNRPVTRPGTRPSTRAPSSPYDATRDRYGFRKKSQHVPLEQYEAWSAPYEEHLARRRKKWVALMKESGLSTDNPTNFPAKSAKVKRFVRKGIPPDWRGAAWFCFAGGPALLDKNPGVYDNLIFKTASGGLNPTDQELIERDLNRTFPDNIRFKPDSPEDGIEGDQNGSNSSRTFVEPETPILQSLRRVLQAFSIFNPRIGYCQSLNFLAGLLLLFMNEEHSFWMLNIITRVYLPGTHEVNLEGANVDLGVLMTSVKESMPSIWAKIGGELDGSAGDGKVSMRLPPITLCCTAWFMSCFIGTLPIETTLRVWDSFFYEGSKTLFRIALAVFKVGETEIKAVSDPMEIFQVVQTIPRRLVDASAMMEACFKRRTGFGHLSQATIEERRKERRQGYADERARAAGEQPLIRKGTLFRRKKKAAVEAAT